MTQLSLRPRRRPVRNWRELVAARWARAEIEHAGELAARDKEIARLRAELEIYRKAAWSGAPHGWREAAPRFR